MRKAKRVKRSSSKKKVRGPRSSRVKASPPKNKASSAPHSARRVAKAPTIEFVGWGNSLTYAPIKKSDVEKIVSKGISQERFERLLYDKGVSEWWVGEGLVLANGKVVGDSAEEIKPSERTKSDGRVGRRKTSYLVTEEAQKGRWTTGKSNSAFDPTKMKKSVEVLSLNGHKVPMTSLDTL